MVLASPKAAHLSSTSAEVWKEFTMPQAKQTSKLKRRSKALPVLGPQDYHCHSQAPRPQSLVGWGICQPQRPEMTIESLSVRKTSALRRSISSTRKAKAQESLSVKRRLRTSAWRRSTSSTKKATERPRWYNLSATAAADATVAAAVVAA